MKLALIFLAIFVAMSHQQHYHNPRMMFTFPWLALPIPNQHASYNDYEAMNDDVYPVDNKRNFFTTEEEGEEFEDTQSRVKGISRYRPIKPSFQDQQNARFLFNLFATTTGSFNNPLLKTATFTSTVTLSLNSVQNCVPASEAIANIQPCQPNQQAIGRRRRDTYSSYVPEDLQFPITPSNTFNLISTALPTSNDRLDPDLDLRSSSLLSSSKDDINLPEISTEDHHNSREKRFFINKNQFVVSTVSTTFVFVNSTILAPVNLIFPPPAAGVVPCPAVVPPVPPQAAPVCLLCLPPGFTVCPVPAAG